MRKHIIVEAPRWWFPIETALAIFGAFVAGFFLRGVI